MDEQIHRLVEKVYSLYESKDPSQRLLISIAGIPGSGKTTLATRVSRLLNARYHQLNQTKHPNSPSSPPIVPDISTSLPLDGFHLTRNELSALPNPEEAHFRRGAAFTFNADAYLDLIRKLRDPILPETRTIHAPSFDHAIKDPIEDDIPIPSTTRIVIIEGNYLALDLEPWSTAARLMDEVWFLDVPLPIARSRLIKRHVASGICDTEAYAARRVDESDLRNATEILDTKLPSNIIKESITSREDGTWSAKTPQSETALEQEKHWNGMAEVEREVSNRNHDLEKKEEAEANPSLPPPPATATTTSSSPHPERPIQPPRHETNNSIDSVGSSGGSSLIELARAGGGC